MWNSAASNLLLSFPYHVFYFFFFWLICMWTFFYCIYAAYIFIFVAEIHLLWGLITKRFRNFLTDSYNQRCIICGLFFFRCIIIGRGGVGMAWRNLCFSFFVYFKSQSHRNENFLMSSSYYYETELLKMCSNERNFPSEFSPVPTSSFSLPHSLASLLIKLVIPACKYNKQNFTK